MATLAAAEASIVSFLRRPPRESSLTRAVAVEAQAGDNPMLGPLLADYRSRHGRRPGRLLADKAYAHDSTRARLRQARIAHTIPERSDQVARRAARGSRGGRPPGFDPNLYRNRNTIERGFNRLKHWRGIATRYDKYALTYLGGLVLAATITYHRTH